MESIEETEKRALAEVSELVRACIGAGKPVPLDDIVEQLLARHPDLSGPDAGWYRARAREWAEGAIREVLARTRVRRGT